MRPPQRGERSVIARAFSPAHHRAAAARLRLPERAAVVALLVLLHAALLYLIHPKFALTQMRPLNEITLSFHTPKPPETAPPAINPLFVAPSAPTPVPPQIPQSVSPSSQPAAPDIAGVGRSLFNCDIASAENPAPEQRANCFHFGAAPPVSGTAEAGMPKNSRVKNSVLWAAQLSARQTPPEAPCTSLKQQAFGGPGVQKPVTALMADPLCLLNGLLNGFHAPSK